MNVDPTPSSESALIPPHLFHDLFTDRETDTYSFELRTVVQSFEDTENLFQILFRNADNVVPYDNCTAVRAHLR